jgi:hypothetical protein
MYKFRRASHGYAMHITDAVDGSNLAQTNRSETDEASMALLSERRDNAMQQVS